MDKRRNTSQKILLTCLLSVMVGVSVYSQITILPPNLGFSQACASESFNVYEFTFSFYPVQNLGPNNVFIVELSDASGNFSAPTTVATLNNTASPVSGDFALPTDTGGENYRIRIRSTDPVQVSDPSSYFSAYYAIHNQPYSINNYNSQVNICEGETFLLEIDDTGTPASPLYYPFLTYVWYKDFIEIPNENGPTLLVSEPGDYYSIVDYGSCVMNSYSNIVSVGVATSINPTISTDDGNTTICLPQSKTLISDYQSATYDYTWYKDGVAIANSNAPTYDATEAGSYFVEIDDSGCLFTSNSIVLDVDDYQVSLDPDQDEMLLPGETVTLTATTTAQTYTVQWYKDEIVLTGETQMQLTVSQPGTYKVVVSQTVPCTTEKEASVTIVFPDYFNLAVDTDAFYTPCNSVSTNLQITQFEAVSAIETRNLLGTSPNFDYQWFKDGNPVSGATGNSYNVSGASENGTYNLEVAVPNFGTVPSNPVPVNLGIGAVTISSQGPLCEGQSTSLTTNISDAQYNYQWFKDGNPISGAVSETFTATEEGSYHLEVESGTCTQSSNTLILEYGQITVSSSNPSLDVLIPGQTKQLVVTTDAFQPTFTWYRNNIVINGATSNVYEADEDGDYKVVVTQTGACNISEELTLSLEYPLSFTIGISPSFDYVACSSTATNLIITEFIAQTNSGDIDILNNDYGYGYQWLKDGLPISGATTTSYNVSDAQDNGIYTLEVTIPSFGAVPSNNVTVNLGLGPVTIENQTPLCPGEPTIITSNITGTMYTYQWFKDGNPISGAVSETYTATEEGNYLLEIDHGSCSVQSNELTLAYGDISINSITPENNLLLPGETKTVQVSTNAQQPTFAWYKDGVAIPNATASSLAVTAAGVYKVVVTQTEGCIVEAEKEFTFNSPTGYNITIEKDPNYDECTSESLNIYLLVFEAVTPNGTIDVLNNPNIQYTAQWYRDETAVTNATETSITLNNPSQNGLYKLLLDIVDFGTVASNEVNANLANNTPLVITSNGLLCENNPQVDINSSIVEPSYSYSWFKDGVLIETNNQATITVTTEGSYSLTIDTGNCSKESNVLVIEEASIAIENDVPLSSTLIPGATTQLSVSTNAIQPNYNWYKDNVLITGETTNSLTIDQAGEYKVVVTQTIGCVMEEELSFTVQYPENFTLVITPDETYRACQSTATVLSVFEFYAETPEGTIDLLNNPYRYDFQWYKNATPIAGATDMSLAVVDYTENGEYYVTVEIPDYSTVSSNKLNITLAFIDAVTIESEGILCESNAEVLLYSNVSNTDYEYKWYADNNSTVLGTQPELTVTEEGTYYLTVAYNGCEITSNTLTVTSLDSSVVTLDHPETIELLEGTTITVTAAGADSYTWYFNNEIVSTTAEIEISGPGIYLLVALVGNCEVTKEITVTEIENKTVAIPNVITLNGDGINDHWALPKKYVGKENVDVIIYGPDGTVVFRDQNYQNTWPDSSFGFSPKQPVYYYTILEDNVITKKGTITIIK
ncbi:T9SS type B sorting domain-containing protein [Marixanthomonas spongiae]|uniref:Ig-like domain-containing protein n=1 Tax=Marixanthomonas spongiae TaxID=2174845 RepID=A0A2U0I440_9FLAO|nr:gliding motility-associated C-terminal domain-containing protein [Marixanthomonas spongiae]PVW15885.1 hypothetical protein DDV96_06365 [Marixanthomonas spongiae]